MLGYFTVHETIFTAFTLETLKCIYLFRKYIFSLDIWHLLENKFLNNDFLILIIRCSRSLVDIHSSQPRGKRILIDSHPSSFNPSTFKSFKGSKKKEERRTAAGNKTTVWTVYSTAEIMEIPRNDGHEGLLKRIAGCIQLALFSLCPLTPHRRGGCCQRSCSSAYRRATLSLQPLFRLSPPEALFFDQLLFRNDRVRLWTPPVQQGRGIGPLNSKFKIN